MSKSMLLVAGMLGLMTLAGCSYYKVTDPTTGREYYTQKLDRKAGGAFAFTDERTKAEVTLQNSEVLKISEETYRSKVAAPSSSTTTNTTTTTTTTK
jgi:hypothetical protein